MNATMVGVSESIMSRLRESTAELHESVEKHPFQASLMAGTLPREAFVGFLGQMWIVHRCLEGELRVHRPSDRAIEAVVREYQFKERHLAADLCYFGTDPQSVLPLAATLRLLEAIETLSREAPFALLGMQYVLEGSTNGGKFVAGRVRTTYGLPGPDGLRYLDPYGDQQRGYWQTFKQAMDGQNFSASQQDGLLDAAKTMFAGIGDICEDLWRARAAQ